MKLNELNFKVITGTITRNQQIFPLITALGFDIENNCMASGFVRISDGVLLYKEARSDFDIYPQPEVTFKEALELLKNCEPEVKKQSGKFVEYDIEPDGKFETEFNRIFWQDFINEEDDQTIFAGWLWENPFNPEFKKWSMRRYGVSGDTINAKCSTWDYPMVPTKIRFWVKE